jgi:hypothetical protein
MRAAAGLLLTIVVASCASAAVTRPTSPLCEGEPPEADAGPTTSGWVSLRLPPGFGRDQRRFGHFGVERWVRGSAEITVDLNGLTVPQPAACSLVLDGFEAAIHEFRVGGRHFVAADLALHGARLDLIEDGLIPARATVYAGTRRRSELPELRAALASIRIGEELRSAIQRARAIEERQRGEGFEQPR